MLKTFIRPAMIFIPLGAGMFFPQAVILSPAIRWLLMVMLLMVFLQLNLKDLKVRRSHFYLLLVNVLIGVASYLVTWWITGNDILSKAAFFVGITPTATAAAVVMGFLSGNVGYVITSFVFTNVGIAFVMPALMGWVCGNTSWDFMLRVFESLFYLLVIPYAAAMVVRKVYPAAREWPKKCKTATFSLWSFTLFIIAAIAADFFKKNPDISMWIVAETALIALIICIVDFGLGYFLGEKDLRHEASQSLGQKNTTLTIYLALVYAGPLAAMGVISYVLWHNSYNAVQLFLHDRKKALAEAEKE